MNEKDTTAADAMVIPLMGILFGSLLYLVAKTASNPGAYLLLSTNPIKCLAYIWHLEVPIDGYLLLRWSVVFGTVTWLVSGVRLTLRGLAFALWSLGSFANLTALHGAPLLFTGNLLLIGTIGYFAAYGFIEFFKWAAKGLSAKWNQRQIKDEIFSYRDRDAA